MQNTKFQKTKEFGRNWLERPLRLNLYSEQMAMKLTKCAINTVEKDTSIYKGEALCTLAAERRTKTIPVCLSSL